VHVLLPVHAGGACQCMCCCQCMRGVYASACATASACGGCMPVRVLLPVHAGGADARPWSRAANIRTDFGCLMLPDVTLVHGCTPPCSAAAVQWSQGHLQCRHTIRAGILLADRHAHGCDPAGWQKGRACTGTLPDCQADRWTGPRMSHHREVGRTDGWTRTKAHLEGDWVVVAPHEDLPLVGPRLQAIAFQHLQSSSGDVSSKRYTNDPSRKCFQFSACTQAALLERARFARM
jgi:hypothetical protein